MPPPRSTLRRREGGCKTLESHSFSELLAWAGELLHTPERMSTFMTTVPLSPASSILKRGSDRVSTWTSQARSRSTPHRLYCLPVKARRKPRLLGPRISSSLFPAFSSPDARSIPLGWTARGGKHHISAAPSLLGGRGSGTSTLLAQPLGRLLFGLPQWWAGTAPLARWQFEDRLRRKPSQRCAAPALLVDTKLLLWALHQTETGPPFPSRCKDTPCSKGPDPGRRE